MGQGCRVVASGRPSGPDAQVLGSVAVDPAGTLPFAVDPLPASEPVEFAREWAHGQFRPVHLGRP